MTDYAFPYRHGWYQLAFDRELTGEVCAASVGPTRLVVVRTPRRVRVADAVCPHRGAHLGFGGRLDGGTLVCPFHGFRIGLSEPSEHRLCVREYDALAVGGLVFVQISDSYGNGFAKVMENLDASHVLVPGFVLKVRAPMELVVENAFDQAHFHRVHGIGISRGFELRPSDSGELVVEGGFELPNSRWQRGQPGHEVTDVPFVARAFSPGIVISELGGAHPYTVITSATPVEDGDCLVRLSLALPPGSSGNPARPELREYLLRRSREGIEKDRVVWEHLTATEELWNTRLDGPVRAFREFCARFADRARG